MIKKIFGAIGRYKLILKVNSLDISKSGIDEDNDPYVVLGDGTTFFGSHVNANLDKHFYKLLSSKTKRTLKYESLQVAVDIVIRYVEGGLQYGGPKKQSRYTVKKGDYVSEMGGYQGFCSVKLAQQVGSQGQVVSIEPMPDNFRLLQKNMKINNLDQVICVNRGVWDSTKELKFNRKKGDGQSSSIEMNYNDAEIISVPADTLDNIFSQQNTTANDFMIIQLNGAEINGLRGLSNFKPNYLSIAARYDTEGVDAARAIKELLEGRGYSVEIDREDFVFATLHKPL